MRKAGQRAGVGAGWAGGHGDEAERGTPVKSWSAASEGNSGLDAQWRREGECGWCRVRCR